jgi:hypothetical protein
MNTYQDHEPGFIADTKAKQRNVMEPDLLHNTSSVDKLLWHGSCQATKVQKAGSLIFGFFFGTIGASFIYWSSWQHEPVLTFAGLPFLLLGIRICFKVFVPTRVRFAHHK